MDPYIQHFQINSIPTFTINTADDCSQILNVNNKDSTFQVLHMNIRSVNKNFDEFLVLLQNLNREFDCIVLSETWKIIEPSIFDINGYELIYNESHFNQNDGVIVYVNSSLNFTYDILPLHNNINALKINITSNINGSVVVTAFYKSPTININEFNASLNAFLERHENNENEIKLFLGDLNINLLEPHDRHTAEYLNILNEFGYKSTINDSTRVQGNSESCLDHIFLKTNVNNYDNILPLVLKTTMTDHFATILQIGYENNAVHEIGDSRYINFINENKLINSLQHLCWDSVYAADNPDIATNEFITIVTNVLNQCTERRQLFRKRDKLAPWLTTVLLNSINKKNMMYKEC